MRRSTICLFVILFVFAKVHAQQPLGLKPTPAYISVRSASLLAADSIQKHPVTISTINPVPSTFYENTLGFFCKKELQVERTIKLPVKFRLGSVTYTDKMEGKPNSGQ